MPASGRQRLLGFYHYDLQFYYWMLRHPTDLSGAKTLLRDHVYELALGKGDGDVSYPGEQVLDEALSSGLPNLPAGPGKLPCGLCSP